MAAAGAIGGPSPMAEEVLLPGLAFGMRNIASMVTGRRDVTIYSQPGVYDPLSSRLVRFHLASSSDWAMLGTAKICCELVNDGDAPLELISTPLGIFNQWRMLSQNKREAAVPIALCPLAIQIETTDL